MLAKNQLSQFSSYWQKRISRLFAIDSIFSYARDQVNYGQLYAVLFCNLFFSFASAKVKRQQKLPLQNISSVKHTLEQYSRLRMACQCSVSRWDSILDYAWPASVLYLAGTVFQITYGLGSGLRLGLLFSFVGDGNKREFSFYLPTSRQQKRVKPQCLQSGQVIV